MEIVEKRQPHSVTYYDENTGKFRLISSAAPLHYLDAESVYQPVDMTPVRVNNAQLDGWRVTSSGWHYALGRPGDKTTDGWVGFGGRRGQHWLRFRLARVGYFDNPAQNPDLGANFYDIGGAPNYNRANLSQQTHTQTIEGTEYKYRSSVRWGNIWTTPAGGELSVQWHPDGARLKEDVVINQAGREWIAANRPPSFFGLPNAGTYFGFVFQIDWSDIPKRVINGVLRESDDDFSDDAGGIELRTALDELIAFLPVDHAYVDTGELVKPQVRLRKRFWKDADGNHYMAVGAPVTQLNALPAGDLIFDPTINTDIQASADDGVWVDALAIFSNDADICVLGNGAGSPSKNWFRFQNIALDGDETIDNAFITLESNRTASTTVVVNVFGVDQDNASNPTDATDANGRPLTSGVAWNINTTWTSGTLYDTPDISSVVDAVIGRTGWSSGNALLFYINHSSGSGAREVASFDHTTRAAPSLTIEYTEPAGGVNVEPLPAPFMLDGVAPGVIKGALSITPAFSASAFFAQAAEVRRGALNVSPLSGALAFDSQFDRYVKGALSITPSASAKAVTSLLGQVVKGAASLSPGTAEYLYAALIGQVLAGQTFTTAPSAFVLTSQLAEVRRGSLNLTPEGAFLRFSAASGQTIRGAVEKTPESANLAFSAHLGEVRLIAVIETLPADYAVDAFLAEVHKGAASIAPVYGAAAFSAAIGAVSIGSLLIFPPESSLAYSALAGAVVRGGLGLTPAHADIAFLSQVLQVFRGPVSLLPQWAAAAFLSTGGGVLIGLLDVPDRYFYVVPHEDRTFTVVSEGRIYRVSPEGRIFSVLKRS